MKGLYRGLVYLALLGLLNACTIRQSYRFLDNLILWQVGRYVSLDSEQKKQAKQHIKDFHKWHRNTQLSLYIDFLQTLKRGLEKDSISPNYLDLESDKLQDLIDISMAKLLPGFVEISESLSPEQITELKNNLEKERQKYREEYIDDKVEKIQKRRIDNISSYVGRFFGSFNSEQKALLQEWTQNLVPYEEAMLAQQRTLEENFVHSLRNPSAPKEIETALRAMMFYRSDDWDPELRTAIQANKALTYKMFSALFMSRNEKQQQRTTQKINAYIEDLSALQR